VINEIDYDNPGTDNFEYLELYNSSTSPVDLGGLELVLVNGDDSSTIAHREYSRFRLVNTLNDAGVLTNVLPAGGYFVAGRGDGGAGGATMQLLVPVPDDALRITWGIGNVVQNAPTDGVGLVHYATGTMVDSVMYVAPVGTQVSTFTIATGVGDRSFTFAEGNTYAPGDIGFDAGVIARQPNGTDTNSNSADWLFVIPYTPGGPNP